MQEKIQKILSEYGICSRRAGEALVQSGRITINGKTASLGDRADPDVDEIRVDGKMLPERPAKEYIVLNKPKGYVVTLNDEKGRKDVTQLLNELPVRVFPVGRLDMNSEGLLLLSNDGEFSNLLMHPSKEIEKEYHVWIKGGNISNAVNLLSRPMIIDGYRIKPAKIKLLDSSESTAMLSVIIHEGRNRQIRKMCEQSGYKVTRLKRIREGSLRLGSLPTGQWRYLSPREVQMLMKEARR